MRPVARRARFVARKRSPDLRIQQFLGHHDRVLAPDVRGVVARAAADLVEAFVVVRSEEHTSELQSLMRISYAVFCLKKKIKMNSYVSLSNLCVQSEAQTS